MHFRLCCECGKEIAVTEGAAGTSVLCECGRRIQVPLLGELRGRSIVSNGFGLPGAAAMQVSSSDIDHVVKLLNAGASPENIRCQLVDRGFDEQSAATVVQNLLLQPVR